MRLSVIIPAYNNLDKVLRCINTLQRTQSAEYDWDDASEQYTVQDDASPVYDLRLLIPDCCASVYRNAQNLGFNRNVVEAVKSAYNFDLNQDLIAIINQDIYALQGLGGLSQSWDKWIIDAFNDPQVGIVGPKLLFPNGAIQSAGGEIDAKGQPSHRCLGYSDAAYHEVNTPEEVTWVTGAFLVVRRELWNRLDGFDPIYAPAYFEDVDLCLRARDAGYKVWYEPRATFVHEVGSTGGSPHFGRSAQAFKQRWVDSGRVRADTFVVRERFW